nr:MAG TPA: hypothetical protein [Caudoviricetes sp.]
MLWQSNARMGLAKAQLFNERRGNGKGLNRYAMELHGTDMSGAAMAMDARRSFDKQRHRTAATCDAMAKNRNDRLRH